jgi:MFS family permease
MASAATKRFLDVVMMGIAFMLIFTAFQSCGMIQTRVLELATRQNATGINKHSGYYSLAIIYISFTLCNFIAAPVIAFIGAKYSMVLGACFYVLFLGIFLKPIGWVLYLCSVALGLGAAVIWTGQGNYLTLKSNEDTIGRNSGVLWALLQCSFLVGSAFLYAVFRGKSDIDSATRTTVYSVFTVLAGLGTVLLLCLRAPDAEEEYDVERRESDMSRSVETSDRSVDSEQPVIAPDTRKQEASETAPSAAVNVIDSFVRTVLLLTNMNMVLLAIVFFYTGLELSFFSGVYGTALANSATFKNQQNAMIGLSGMFIGLGEVMGGGLFGLLGNKTVKHGRNPVILLGLISHIVVFFLIFLNIPERAPLEETSEEAYVATNEYLALFCSYLLGLADSCWNTQIYSILGSMFPDDSAPAFALFKFFQSGAAAIAFFYTPHLTLQWQLLILTICATVSALAFFRVEWTVLVLTGHAKRDHAH